MDEQPVQNAGASGVKNPFASVPIEINVCVGKAKPLIRDLVNLKEASVLMLNTKVDDPVDLYVGDKLIARGILEESVGAAAGQLAVRLTEILDIQRDS